MKGPTHPAEMHYKQAEIYKVWDVFKSEKGYVTKTQYFTGKASLKYLK